MKCTCTKCGKKWEAEELCFDLSEIVVDQLGQLLRAANESDSAEMTMDDSVIERALDKLRSNWKRDHKHAAMFSGKELSAMLQDVSGSGDGTEKLLVLGRDEWRERLEARIPYMGEQEKRESRFILPSGDGIAGIDYNSNRENLLSRHVVVDYRTGGLASIRFSGTDIMIDKRYCPGCGNEMSSMAGRYPEIVMTVIGGPRANKSTALAACLSCFIEHPEYRIQMDGMGDAGWGSFDRDYLKEYQRNRKVAPTQTESNQIPRFSVRITITDHNGTRKSLVLTVVDLPGEFDVRTGEENGDISPDIIRDYADLYENVDFVWYCTDKVELDQIDIADAEDIREAHGYEERHRLLDVHQRCRKLEKYGHLFNKNVAALLLLGKSDTLVMQRNDPELFSTEGDCTGIIDAMGTFGVKLNGQFSPYLNQRDYWDRTYALRQYMMRRNPALINAFEDAFPNHSYVVTSNYGHNFLGEGINMPRSPYMTGVPLLWMLAVAGYLDVGIGTDFTNSEEEHTVWENLCMTRGAFQAQGGNERNRSLLGRIRGR